MGGELQSLTEIGQRPEGYLQRPPSNRFLFDEALLDHLFVREPQVGDVGGAETENVFQRAANLAKMKVHADALEQFDQLLRANGFNRLRTDATVFQSMKRYDVKCLRPSAMAVNVEETPGFRLGRGEPRRHS